MTNEQYQHDHRYRSSKPKINGTIILTATCSNYEDIGGGHSINLHFYKISREIYGEEMKNTMLYQQVPFVNKWVANAANRIHHQKPHRRLAISIQEKVFNRYEFEWR